jgi:hypothetical protein
MKKMFKKIIVMLVVLCTMMSVALANPSEAEVDFIETGTYEYTATTGDYEAIGGNVSTINLESNSSTSRWAGLAGNVSGRLVLGRGSDVFFDFGTDITFQSVYATTAGSFLGTTALVTDVTGLDDVGAWNFASGSDRIQSVFTENIGINELGLNGNTRGRALGNFNTFVVGTSAAPAGKNDVAFGGTVSNAGAEGFDGETYNYQLLLPITVGTEVYNMYLLI